MTISREGYLRKLQVDADVNSRKTPPSTRLTGRASQHFYGAGHIPGYCLNTLISATEPS